MKQNEWIAVIIVMIIISVIVSLITSSLAVKKSPLLSPDDGSGIDTSGTPAPIGTDVVDPIYRNREYQVINSLTISDPTTETIGKLVGDTTSDKKSVYLQQIADGGNLVIQKKGVGSILFKIDDNKIMTIDSKGIWAGVIGAIYGKFIRYSSNEDGVLELGESSYASKNYRPSIIRGEGEVMNITFTEKTLTGVSVDEIKLSSRLGSINLDGKVNLSAIKSGTIGEYVCIDSSGLLFKKSTPCK